MDDASERSTQTLAPPAPVRQPGWVILVGVLGAACLMIGLILLPMLQAPVLRPGVIAVADVLIAIGLALLAFAWSRRTRGRNAKLENKN
jgi:hypothetical protein